MKALVWSLVLVGVKQVIVLSRRVKDTHIEHHLEMKIVSYLVNICQSANMKLVINGIADMHCFGHTVVK